VDYTYHNQLTLNSVLGNFPESYALDTAYDPAGRIVRRRLGTPGTIVAQYSYNPWNVQGGRLGRLSTSDGARLLQDLRYTYDSMGNVLSLQDYWNNNGEPQTQSFSYDALYRLTSAQAAGGLFGNFPLESYTYHPTSGNLESKAGVSYTYGDANHAHAVTSLSNENTYQYDANGNMVSRQVGGQTYTLTYNAENRLVQVSGAATASFVYDGDGKRVLAIEGGTTTVFIGNYFEWSGTAVNAVRYYYAGTTRLAMRRGSGSVTWLLGDHLGSTSVSYDGASALHQGYKPWGETRFGEVGTPYQFTGQYRQASLGLDFFNARWYDPALGRFVQADTLIPEASQGTQAWDRYAFVNNNPVRYNDPTGHDVGCAGEDLSTCYPVEVNDFSSKPNASPEFSHFYVPSSTKNPFPHYSASPTKTPIPLPYYSSAPTKTPSTIPENSFAVKPSIEIDWSKVDKVDLGIDVVGVGLEVGAGIASGAGFPEVGAGFEVAQGAVELMGLGKSIVDVIQGDPNNLLMQQTSSTSQRIAVLLFRAERAVPIIGLLGNAVSLYVNLRPAITVNR
jgi:RHS repeat-associated protein